MKIIQEILINSEYRCDGCSRKLSESNADLLPLFERGFGIRKTSENCLLVCKDAAKSLQEYSLRDQFLLLSGHFGVFECPCKSLKNRVKKEAKTANHKKISSKKKFLEQVKNEPTQEHGSIPKTLSSSAPAEVKHEFNIQRVRVAIEARVLTTTQIRQMLERSEELKLTSEIRELLDSEYNRLQEASRNRSVYTVDPEGVVSFAATRPELSHDFLKGKKEKWASDTDISPAKSKPGQKIGTTISVDSSANKQSHKKRIPKSGYITCSHCKSFMYYTDANSEKCRNCNRPLTI